MRVNQGLLKIREGNISDEDVKHLVITAHGIASNYLKMKRSMGLLNHVLILNNIDDIAWDCIGSLFERDSSNRLIVLQHRFNAFDTSSLSCDDMKIEFRKLVIRHVNDELYKLYSESDRSLSRMIRNLKSAVSDEPDMSVSVRFNKKVILFSPDSPSTRTQSIESEILLIRLCQRLRGQPSVSAQDVLTQTKSIILESEIYKTEFYVSDLALIWRQVLDLLHIDDKEEIKPDSILTPDEIELFIKESVNYFDQTYKAKYVEKGKISEVHWTNYLTCIQLILINQYGEDRDDSTSYFECLKSVLPKLSAHEYTKKHKSYIEYFVRLCNHRLISLVKSEINSVSRVIREDK